MEFKYHQDTDYIMDNRSFLNQGVFVDHEYTDEIERKCKILLLVLKAARPITEYKKKCKLKDDKLVIKGGNFTLNNMDQLPDNLNAFKCTSKSNKNTVGFFGAINPLSNVHPATFTLGGVEYISSEQYIQVQKVEYFKDKKKHRKNSRLNNIIRLQESCKKH